MCNVQNFDKYCDKWDIINKFPVNYSKKSFVFYNNGGTTGDNNLFGFILRECGIHIKMIGYDFHNRKPTIPNDAIGAIFFNTRHTWAVRKHKSDGRWWVHDSLRQPSLYRHRDSNRYAVLYCFNK